MQLNELHCTCYLLSNNLNSCKTETDRTFMTMQWYQRILIPPKILYIYLFSDIVQQNAHMSEHSSHKERRCYKALWVKHTPLLLRDHKNWTYNFKHSMIVFIKEGWHFYWQYTFYSKFPSIRALLYRCRYIYDYINI